MAELFGIEPVWIWLVSGVILLLLEIILSGIYLFWFGLAALATGIITFILGKVSPVLSIWQVQIILFIIFSFLAVFYARKISSNVAHADSPFLNKTIESLLGQTYTLTRPIKDDQTTLSIDGTIWRVKGENLQQGDKIRLVAYKQGFFLVEKEQK